MPRSIEDLKRSLICMVRAVANTPDQCSVDLEVSGTSAHFLIRVPSSDLGQVIGKQGKTIACLRTIALASAQQLGMQASVDVEAGTVETSVQSS